MDNFKIALILSPSIKDILFKLIKFSLGGDSLNITLNNVFAIRKGANKIQFQGFPFSSDTTLYLLTPTGNKVFLCKNSIENNACFSAMTI